MSTATTPPAGPGSDSSITTYGPAAGRGRGAADRPPAWLRRVLPTPAEAATLRFLLPMPDLPTRLWTAGILFALGVAAWSLLPVLGALGLALILIGHLAIWVRSQTTAPGGATPQHEEVWAPVEEDWLERVEALERRGARWDASPWDVSSGNGCLALLGVLAVLAATAAALAFVGTPEPFFRVGVAGVFLFVPLWLNGMRTTWNPSELRKKGEALEAAVAAAREVAGDTVDPVPMLALREGRRGKYPVDARLMLRPAAEDGSGYLGVQVQVAMNNVRGTDYPYVYAVVLGKSPFRWAENVKRRHIDGVDVVFERGGDAEVAFMVVRQHADNRGGWHTEPSDVRTLVATALKLGARAREHNRGKGGSR